MSVLKIKDINGNWQDIPAIKGATGDAGADGITPTIGNNGNWFIGDTDTGLPSRGLQGETGQTGATGPAGQDGTNGRDGYVQYTAGDNITIENNVISATGGSDLPIYNFKSTYSGGADWVTNSTLPADDNITLTNIISDAYDKGYTDFLLFATSPFSAWRTPIMFTFARTVQQLTSKPTSVHLFAYYSINRLSNSSCLLKTVQLSITLSWNDDVPTVTQAKTSVDEIQIIPAGNTQSYTPTGNYNPATKKYVDDSISNKIWIGTQAEYEAITTPSENTIYFIKEDTNVSE